VQFQNGEYGLCDDQRLLVERAFGLGPCSLTEAVQLLTENLGAA
jgi:hypothetical protein